MILDKIVKQVKIDLVRQKKLVDFSKLEDEFYKREIKPINVLNILKRNSNPKIYNIICEVKKASPSKGIIREDFNPVEIAKEYEKAQASCISVLTEEHFFKGSLDYLRDIKNNVKTPLLRKDFIVEKYQIAQAYNCGADMILLIAKILDEDTLNTLYEYATSLKLNCLVEVHDREDLQKALNVNALIVGVNHRNLDDFSMNMDLSLELKEFIPEDKIIIAESGIDNKSTLERLDEHHIDAFLIGEHFMRDDNINSLESFIAR